MCFWNCIQIHIAENSGKSPKILILQPACAAPFVNFNGQFIFTVLKIRGKLKLRRCKTVLTVSNKHSVQPYIKAVSTPWKETNTGLSCKFFQVQSILHNFPPGYILSIPSADADTLFHPMDTSC